MTARKCMGHAVIFQYSIGLPITDDPLIGEKVAFFNFPNSKKKKTVSILSKKNGRGEYQHPQEGIFSVKQPLTFL